LLTVKEIKENLPSDNCKDAKFHFGLYGVRKKKIIKKGVCKYIVVLDTRETVILCTPHLASK